MRFACKQQYGIDKNAANPWLQSLANFLIYFSENVALRQTLENVGIQLYSKTLQEREN